MAASGQPSVLQGVLANRDLRRVLSAYFAFHVAEFATWVTILLYAYDQTGPASVGVVALIQLIPAALAASPASSLGDRYPRARVLAAGYVLQALAMLATAAVMAAAAPVVIVYLVAAVAATTLVVTRPTQSALLPSLARTPDELTGANGAAGVVEGAGVLVGPLIAALVLAVSTPAVVYLIAGAALVVAAMAALGLHERGGLEQLVQQQREATTGTASILPTPDRSFLAGLRVVAADADARLVVGLLTGRTLMIGCADVLFVYLALELLNTGDPGAGVLNAALGAGTIVGGALTFLLIGREGLALIAAGGAIVWGVTIVLVDLTAAALLAPILIVVGGAGLAIVDVAGRTLLQRSISDDVLSRVFGIQEGLAMGALAVGSILVAVLAEAFGLSMAILIVALILPVAVGLSWGRFRSLDARAAVPTRALELLRGTRLFAPLPGPQLEAVARRGAWLTYPSRTVLIREGDPGDRYYVLASGAVRVDKAGQFIRDLGARGDGFGEIALLRDVPRTATVTTTTEVAVFGIDRADFLAAVTGHPDAYAAAATHTSELAPELGPGPGLA
jgi:MFS family permease